MPSELDCLRLIKILIFFFIILIEKNLQFSQVKGSFSASYTILHQPLRLSRDIRRSKSTSSLQQGADPSHPAALYLLIGHHLCKHSFAFLSKHGSMLPMLPTLLLFSPKPWNRSERRRRRYSLWAWRLQVFSPQMCTGWMVGLIWNDVKDY